jgi:hypothetical protein
MPVPGLLAGPPPIPPPTSDIPNIVLTGGDGQQWVLTDPIGSQVLLMKGATGLSLPPNTAYLSDTPGAPGAFRTGAHDDPRAVFLPLYCEGNSRAQQVANLRALQRSVHWSRGPCQLAWAESDGSRRYLDMTYASGLEGNDAAENADLQWEVLGANFLAENPYLYGDPVSPAPWTGASPPAFFPMGGFPIRLGSSSVFGSTVINNVGEVEAWPTWRLDGPATGLTVQLNATTSFQLNLSADPLLVGEHIIVTTDPKADVLTVVDDTGANRFTTVAPNFAFFPLPSGTSAVSISVSGSTSATQLSMTYRPQYLRV